jgi:hypothetical protein
MRTRSALAPSSAGPGDVLEFLLRQRSAKEAETATPFIFTLT